MRLLITTLAFIFITFSAQALEFKFATPEEAAAILTADDNYFNRMSPAEIAIRMESGTTDKTTADLKAQYASAVRAWSEEEKLLYAPAIEEARENLESMASLLPETILLIRTTNQVEGGLRHTRDGAIVFPENNNSNAEITPFVLYHEAFHILSRTHAARHDSLYGLIGFRECDLKEPPAVFAMHITNPDVPAEGFYMPLSGEDGPFNIVPFLYAAYPAFEASAENGFSSHFGFGLMKVTVKDGVCLPVMKDGEPVLLDPGAVPGFFDHIGRNTAYIIHPEETLANNFAFLMEGKEDLPNPEILEHLATWLKQGH